jgi:hypothetical protein
LPWSAPGDNCEPDCAGLNSTCSKAALSTVDNGGTFFVPQVISARIISILNQFAHHRAPAGRLVAVLKTPFDILRCKSRTCLEGRIDVLGHGELQGGQGYRARPGAVLCPTGLGNWVGGGATKLPTVQTAQVAQRLVSHDEVPMSTRPLALSDNYCRIPTWRTWNLQVRPL